MATYQTFSHSPRSRMRLVRQAIAANWRVFTAIYVATFLLEWVFGWAGLCFACALVFVLRHRVFDLSRRSGIMDADNAGDRA